MGREDGWVFLSTKGTPLEYRNWIRHGWHPALKRAGVQPRVRDAQKALRRTYVTSSLVLDRNPKLVAAELAHHGAHGHRQLRLMDGPLQVAR